MRKVYPAPKIELAGMPDDHRTAGVYEIRNSANGRTYIGVSQDVRTRLTTHISALEMGKHHKAALQADWRTYGPGVFVVGILERVTWHPWRSDARAARAARQAIERRWIMERRPFYNNATYHTCPHCGERYLCTGRGEALAAE